MGKFTLRGSSQCGQGVLVWGSAGVMTLWSGNEFGIRGVLILRCMERCVLYGQRVFWCKGGGLRAGYVGLG